jgi:hypothetical protein
VKKSVLTITVAILAILALVSSSCSPGPEPDYAGAIAENILQAMNTGDYPRYSTNFDEAMKIAMPEAVFQQTNTVISGKIGTYVSKQYAKTQVKGPYTTVYYKAKFTGETGDVTVKVVFQQIAGKPYVSGLWMDSPKLRK